MTRTPLRLRLDGLEVRTVPSAVAPPAATAPAQQTPTVAPTPTPTPAATGSAPTTPITGTAATPGADTPTPPPAPTPGPTAPATGTTPPSTGTTAPPAAGTTTPPTTTPTTTAPAPIHPIPPVHLTHALTGRGTGTYQLTQANPDTGAGVKFQGTATMAGLGGPVAVAGDLHVPGNVANPVTTGTVVLSTKAGSVTVTLTSFRPAAGSAAPVWYRYQVTAGTGSMVGLHDSGSLRLDWVPAPAGKPAVPPAAGATTGVATTATATPGGATTVNRGSFRLTV